MSDFPKLRTRKERINIGISIAKKVEEIYRLAKQNGWDSSEIARQAVEETFLKNEEKFKRPAS